MYERVLFPTDGSEPADHALDYAVDAAASHGATLRALYVVDTAAYGSLDLDESVIVEGYERQGERVLDRVVAAAEAAGVDVETGLAYGTPHREILAHVADWEADLVVMGSHGRRGLERTILGSVTERVARLSAVPVLVVPLDE